MKQSITNYIISDKWQVLQHVGSGGVGSVFEGRHIGSGKRCAVKVLHTEHEVRDAIIERFYQEILILRRLRHPGIVEVHEFGFEEALGFYLVMEYLEGCSLSDMISKVYGDIPLEWIYRWFTQVCDAMHYSHQKEVVHRDLKPDHVFFVGGPERDDTIKIIDFGIAKFTMGENPNLTQSGTTLGTPRYLSPEQAMGKDIDHRADVYALTVILFELLTRHSVFRAETSLQYMMHHAYTDPPTLAMVRQDRRFPKELEQLVADGLSKDPDARPESMGVFKERLFQSMKEMLHTEELSVLESNEENLDDSSMYRISRQSQTNPNGNKKIKIGGAGGSTGDTDNFLDQLAHELANEPLPERKKAKKMRAAKISGNTNVFAALQVSEESKRLVLFGIAAACLLILGAVLGLMLSGKNNKVPPTKRNVKVRGTKRPSPRAPLTKDTEKVEDTSVDAGDDDDDDDDDDDERVLQESVDSDAGVAEEPPKSPKSKEDWLKIIQRKLKKQKRDKARIDELMREIKKRAQKANPVPDRDPKVAPKDDKSGKAPKKRKAAKPSKRKPAPRRK